MSLFHSILDAIKNAIDDLGVNKYKQLHSNTITLQDRDELCAPETEAILSTIDNLTEDVA